MYWLCVRCQLVVGRWGAKLARPQLIVFKTSAEDGIPIDILPLLDPNPGKSDVSERLGNWVRKISRSSVPLAWEFTRISAIVKRDIGNALAHRDWKTSRKLPIKMFINRSHRGARQEELDLTNNAGISTSTLAGLTTRTLRKMILPRCWPPTSGKSAQDLEEANVHFRSNLPFCLPFRYGRKSAADELHDWPPKPTIERPAKSVSARFNG